MSITSPIWKLETGLWNAPGCSSLSARYFGKDDPLRRGARLAQFKPGAGIDRDLPVAGNRVPQIERPHIHPDRAVV
jgi:hypothetical protein